MLWRGDGHPKDIPGQRLPKVCPGVVQEALRALRCRFVDRPLCAGLACECLTSYGCFLITVLDMQAEMMLEGSCMDKAWKLGAWKIAK